MNRTIIIHFAVILLTWIVFNSCSKDKVSTEPTNHNEYSDNFEWVDVPAGPFTWGVNDEVRNIDYNFKIMKYEVTNTLYVEYLEEKLLDSEITVTSSTVTGYYEGDQYWSAGTYQFYDIDDGDNRIHWNGSDFTIENGYEDHPVFEVTWFGADAFSKHYSLSLPTEEEWEKAARGNTGWDYPWGDDPPTCQIANYNYCNSGTIPVGQTTGTSPYGAYDMAGNVYEWCSNYNSIYYSNFRTIRGGSWQSGEGVTSWYGLHFIDSTDQTNTIGFRCVRTN